MKKIISIVLSVIMMLSTVVVASALSYDGFTYRTTLSKDKIVITGYTGTKASVTVPTKIKNLPVAEINQEAFMYNKTVTSIDIPSSVEKIGDKAFMYCSNLSQFDFSGAKATVGINAFYGCSSLTKINGADNVTKINSSAFDATAWLNNRADGAVYIGKVLYKYKGEMPANTKITVKSGTVSIAPDAFANQKNLISVTFPTSLKNVGNRAFCGCTSLKSVTLMKHIESIENAAFGFREIRSGTSISYVPIEGFKIYTEKDSAAHNYAKLGGIAYEFVGGEQKVLVTSLKLNTSSITWDVGKSGSFKPTVLPENADNKVLEWSSSNKSVATVSAEGKLTAVGPGVATITCKTTDGSNLTATCKVTVNGVAGTVKITRIKFSKSSDKLSAGKTYDFNPTITPADATNKNLTWESSDTSILKVDSNGRVTAVSVGKATLTCKTTDGSNKKATCRITVNPSTPQSVIAKKADTAVNLTWSESLSAIGYYVYRATSENGTYTRVGKTKTANFTDSKAKAGKTYYYKVVAYNYASLLLYKSTKSLAAKVSV